MSPVLYTVNLSRQYRWQYFTPYGAWVNNWVWNCLIDCTFRLQAYSRSFFAENFLINIWFIYFFSAICNRVMWIEICLRRLLKSNLFLLFTEITRAPVVLSSITCLIPPESLKVRTNTDNELKYCLFKTTLIYKLKYFGNLSNRKSVERKRDDILSWKLPILVNFSCFFSQVLKIDYMKIFKLLL